MANAFRCRVITPEARLLDEDATSVVAPLHDGQMGFLPGRAPIAAKLGVGELQLTLASGARKSYLVDDGFLQMVNNRLTVLAAVAVPAEGISEAEAQAEVAEATARQPKPGDKLDAERVNKQRNRARAKLALARSKR